MSLSAYQRELSLLLGEHLPSVLGATVAGYFEFPALPLIMAFLTNLHVQRCKHIGGQYEVNDFARALNLLLGDIKWFLPGDLKTFNITPEGLPVPAHLEINCDLTVPPTIDLEGRVRRLTSIKLAAHDLFGGLLCQFAELVKDHFDGGCVRRFEQLVEEDYEHQPPAKRTKKSIRKRGPCA